MIDAGSLGWSVKRWTDKLVALLALVGLSSMVLSSLDSSEARAAEPGSDALPVHVVAVKSLEALDQAQALTTALKKAVRSSEGWFLADSNQSLEFLAIQMQCAEPIDAACEARIADELQADRYLWSVIEFDPADKSFVKGKLNFFVRGKGTSSVDIRYSANLTDPNDDSLLSLVEDAVDEVTGGAPKGTLKVSTGGVAGQIFIDGEPMGALPAEGMSYPLPAGEHRVVVKAPGYADAESTVNVRPATTVETTLTLVQVQEQTPVDWRMVTGFGLVGVGVATGAVGLWSALEVNSIRSDEIYQRFQDATFRSSGGVCEAAARGPDGAGSAYNIDPGNGPTTTPSDADVVAGLCDDAGSFELIQAIVFPVAAVSTGVGFYLLGTSSLFGGDEDGGDDLSAWTVQPIARPGLGAVGVTYQF